MTEGHKRMMDALGQAVVSAKKVRLLMKRCPECSHQLRLEPVTMGGAPQIGLCDACGWDGWLDGGDHASDPSTLRAMAERWADRAEADEPVWIETTEGWRFHVNSISGVLHAVATAMEEAGEP